MHLARHYSLSPFFIFGSFYYVGIILVMMASTMVLPLNTSQAALSTTLIYLCYLIPVFLFTKPTIADLHMLFYSSFFFFGFSTIAIILCHQETKARKREFALKMELDCYAQDLEKEVEQRAGKLLESEMRYRELFDNMVDIVILTDPEGQIIMANSLFKKAGFQTRNNPKLNFMDCIHPDDAQIVTQMFENVKNDRNAMGFQFRLRDGKGQGIFVETNATPMKIGRKTKGYQMMIRDITLRKRLESELLESYKDFKNARVATILGLAKLAEYRDTATGNHLERIREFTRLIALELSKHPKYSSYISKEYIEDLYLSVILHDIGKVGIPDAILLKSGKLTPEEFTIIKKHTLFGGDILKIVESKVKGQSFISLGKEIAYSHHEKWDGTGYPKGLKGEDIPLSTRIVALADVYDALTSKRNYKKAYSHTKAVEIIYSERGTHFDPDIVDASMRQEKQFKKLQSKMPAISREIIPN